MIFWKSKKTALLVALTLIVMAAMMYAQHSNAETYIGLGRTVANSSLTVPAVGYRTANYGFELTGTGAGDTKRGYQSERVILSAYRVIDPQWCAWSACLKSAIGVSYAPDQMLVGPFNFRLEFYAALALGVEFAVIHYSSAGYHERNTGIDVGGQLRFVF